MFCNYCCYLEVCFPSPIFFLFFDWGHFQRWDATFGCRKLIRSDKKVMLGGGSAEDRGTWGHTRRETRFIIFHLFYHVSTSGLILASRLGPRLSDVVLRIVGSLQQSVGLHHTVCGQG